MKVGVVGTGRMGKHHVRNFYRLEKEGLVELVAICDIDPKKEYLAKMYGCRFYRSYIEMIKKESLEAVSIAVPTSYHEKVTMPFLESGVHVLVEKPISYSINSAERMIRKSKETKTQLMVGHIEIFNPVTKRLKEYVKKGVLGEILSLNSRRLGMARVVDCGVILDLGTHDIYLILHLLENKKPIKLYCSARKIFPYDFEDYASIQFLFEDDIICHTELSRLTKTKIRELSVLGTRELNVESISLIEL